jgi:hypothetical protein
MESSSYPLVRHLVSHVAHLGAREKASRSFRADDDA